MLSPYLLDKHEHIIFRHVGIMWLIICIIYVEKANSYLHYPVIHSLKVNASTQPNQPYPEIHQR